MWNQFLMWDRDFNVSRSINSVSTLAETTWKQCACQLTWYTLNHSKTFLVLASERTIHSFFFTFAASVSRSFSWYNDDANSMVSQCDERYKNNCLNRSVSSYFVVRVLHHKCCIIDWRRHVAALRSRKIHALNDRRGYFPRTLLKRTSEVSAIASETKTRHIQTRFVFCSKLRPAS